MDPSSRASRLLLGAISLLFCFGLLEGVLRVQYAPSDTPDDQMMIVRSANPRLVYELRPDHRVSLEAFEVETNSAGFRGSEFPEAKPPGVFRIAIVGDSVTFGLRVEWEEAFPRRLEQGLRQSGHAVEVLAFGVPGYNSIQEVELVRTRILDYDPDLLLVAYVLNDHKEDSGLTEAFQGSASLAVLWLRERGRELYRRLIWSVTEEAFEELSRIGSERELPVAVVIFPMMKRKSDGSYRYGGRRDAVAEVARRSGFASFDLYDAYLEAGFEDLGLDRVHPNPRGHAVAAEQIQAFLEREGLLP